MLNIKNTSDVTNTFVQFAQLKKSDGKKIIVRIKGGLGNQLFCYAAARRLALINNAELVIDDVTGFVRDHQYRRQYMLDHFCITARKATPSERLEPFERCRRSIMKWLSRRKPFAERRYLEQERWDSDEWLQMLKAKDVLYLDDLWQSKYYFMEGLDFDERLLMLKVKDTLYLDGLWQSEAYFKDVEQTIRKDLQIIPPTDVLNQRMAEEIHNSQSVALHVRWFNVPGNTADDIVSTNYCQRASALMEEKVNLPQYFLFSDNPEAARANLVLPEGRVTCVSHNGGDENAYADLWLMTQCKHFITANSTFSWWGAWLSPQKSKIITSEAWWKKEDKLLFKVV